jgi:hypothetical protein
VRLLRKLGQKAIFLLIYAVAIAVSFIFIGSAFVFVMKMKSGSVAVLVTAVVIGGITPLAAANYSIENWKKRSELGLTREKLGLKGVVSGFFELFAIFISMIVTAGFTAVIGLTAGEYAPVLLELPPVVLASPALIAGIASYLILAVTKELLIGMFR